MRPLHPFIVALTSLDFFPSVSSEVTRDTVILRRTANDYRITKALSDNVFGDNADNVFDLCGESDGTLIFSHPMSLKSGDRFFNVGIMQQRAMEMMVDQINTSPKCGVRVNGRRYTLSFITYGDDSSNEKARAIADYAVSATPDKADFFVGPYSSGLTGASVAPVAHETSKILIAGGAAATHVFKDRPTVFGTFPPTRNYLAQAIRGLSEIGAKTVAGIWESSTFTKGVCAALPELAEMYNMTYLDAIEVPASPTAEQFDPIVQNISQPDVNPDVVVTCVYDAGCIEWVQSLRRADWSPKAQVLTVCIGMETFEDAIGTDAEYMMGVTPWDKSLHSTDALTHWTAREFYDQFFLTTQRTPTYHAASAASSLGIIVQAIERANSIATNDVVAVLANETFQTLYGDISFDFNGQSKAPSLLVQYDGDMEVQTVFPYEQKSNDIIYPMPTWSLRDCVKLSDCVSSNNTCTEDGYCSCSDPALLAVGRGASAACHHIPDEDYTFIRPGLKTTGIALVSVQGMLSLGCAIWTFKYRNQSIVRISQPLFLGLVSFGTFLMSTAIIPIGIEEGYRYRQDPLTGELTDQPNPNIYLVDGACMAFPWLFGVGFTIVFSALFAKIWRVEKLLTAARSFRRVKIQTKDVASVMIVMLSVEIAILLSWQFLDPLKWQRIVLTRDAQGYPMHSVGKCESNNEAAFAIPFIILNLLSLLFALYKSYKVRDFPSDFHEGTYITASVVMILQLLLLGVPIMIISEEQTDAYYLVRAGLMFLMSSTVTCFIFLPKMGRLHLKGKADAASSEESFPVSLSERQKKNYSFASLSISRSISAVGFERSISAGGVDITPVTPHIAGIDRSISLGGVDFSPVAPHIAGIDRSISLGGVDLSPVAPHIHRSSVTDVAYPPAA